jgi:hypothetical protein
MWCVPGRECDKEEKMNRQRGFSVVATIWSVAGVLVAFAASCFLISQYHIRTSGEVQFTTPYQMVVFANNAAYFGKLEGFGTSHPVLRDVYYVVSQMDPQTKQPKNVLVKRGNEWHAPDRMYINPNQILMVEPVSPNSKVAQLIQELKQKD